MAEMSKAQVAFVTNNYSAPAVGTDKRRQEQLEEEETKALVYHDWTDFGKPSTYDPAKEQERFRLIQTRDQLSQNIRNHEQNINQLDSSRYQLTMQNDRLKMDRGNAQWQLTSMEDKQRTTDNAVYRVREKLRDPKVKGDERWSLESQRSQLQSELYRLNDAVYNMRSQIQNMDSQIRDNEYKINEMGRNLDSARTEMFRLKDMLARVEQQLNFL